MGNVQMLLRQHVGAPCAPCVEVGAEVKKGTLIATPTGLGANIFSSVYGKVTEITEDRIIIEPAAEQPDEFVPVTESVEGITDESSKLDLVKAAGIVGMGGAGFPTGVKLNINLEETPMGELDPEINPELPKDFKLDCGYILVNAAECEPGLEHNTRQIEEQSDKSVVLNIVWKSLTQRKQLLLLRRNIIKQSRYYRKLLRMSLISRCT